MISKTNYLTHKEKGKRKGKGKEIKRKKEKTLPLLIDVLITNLFVNLNWNL